jgi:hypothetical protein
VLSQNVFDSGGGVKTSGYSTFGTQRPGATVQAFEGALAPHKKQITRETQLNCR